MEDHTMKTDFPFSRRRLLASVPAVAAAAVPATAVALPGLATAVPGHLDGHQVRGLAEMLSALEGLPKGEANKVLTAIKETIECSMRNYEHDAPLLALKPKFDAAFEDWWKRHEAWKAETPAREAFNARFEAEVERRTGLTSNQGRALADDDEHAAYLKTYRETREAMITEEPLFDDRPPRTDAEINEWAGGLADLTDEILSHQPITREGLALQCRAMIMDGYGAWDDDGRTARFIGNMVLFFNWKLPDMLAVELLTSGQEWDDEDEDEDEEGNNNEA
jgi:hypothetical protein